MTTLPWKGLPYLHSEMKIQIVGGHNTWQKTGWGHQLGAWCENVRCAIEVPRASSLNLYWKSWFSLVVIQTKWTLIAIHASCGKLNIFKYLQNNHYFYLLRLNQFLWLSLNSCVKHVKPSYLSLCPEKGQLCHINFWDSILFTAEEHHLKPYCTT